MTLFGDNLKQIRAAKNISQNELAQKINMHSTHISRYERNLTSPTIEVVKKIAEYLEVSTDTLVYGTDEEKAKNNIKDNELLNMFTKVQSLKQDDILCIKSLLNAYILKTNLQQQLAH